MKMPEQTNAFNYYNVMDQQMQEYSRRYRIEENECRDTGLKIQKRYVNVLSSRNDRVNSMFEIMSTVGDKHQRELPGRLRRTLRCIERWVQLYCDNKHVTLTHHFIFVAPVHTIARHLDEDVRTVNSHIKLLGVFGFLELVDNWRFGTPYIGVSGIRAQLYRFTHIDCAKILRLWHRWCNSGGSLRRVSHDYIRQVFGRRMADKLYLRSEANKTEQAEEQRKINREYKNSDSCWQNHKDIKITQRHSLYRKARAVVQKSYGNMKKYSRRPVLTESGTLVCDGRGKTLWRSVHCDQRRARAYWDNGDGQGKVLHELRFDQLMNVSKLLTILNKHYAERVFVEVCKKHRWFRTTENFHDSLDAITGKTVKRDIVMLDLDESQRIGSRDWHKDQRLVLEAAGIIQCWFPEFTKLVLSDLFGDIVEQAPVDNTVFYSRVWDNLSAGTTDLRSRALGLIWKIDIKQLDFTGWMSVMSAAKCVGLTYDDLIPWCLTDYPRRFRPSDDRPRFNGFCRRYSIDFGTIVNAAHNYKKEV